MPLHLVFDQPPECTEHPGMFFPTSNGSKQALETERAKAICGRCPYRSPCLTWALNHHESGIWGGTTTKERKLIRRGQRLAQRNHKQPGHQMNRYELYRATQQMINEGGLTLHECAEKLGYTYSHLSFTRAQVVREIQSGSWRP